MSTSPTNDSFTGSGMHPEVTYTVRIDGVSVNEGEMTVLTRNAIGSTPYCRICRFGEFESSADNLGKCRRNSPSPDKELGTAKWPIVAWNDWCGDWEHK